MPYPIVHLMFFMFCLFLVGIYGFLQTAFEGGVCKKDWWHLLLLLSVGSLCSLLPDVPAVWNYLLYGELEHTMAGVVPTHSIAFSFVAFGGSFLIGLVVYRHRGRALALGLFAEAAFLSHLLLDDVANGYITYFYPFYNRSFSFFSYVNVDLSMVNFIYYNIAGIMMVIFISSVLLMTFISLNYLGFGFKYEPLKSMGPRRAEVEMTCDKIERFDDCYSKVVQAEDTTKNRK